MAHNKAVTNNKANHPADKYRADEKPYDPIAINETNKLVKKQVELIYKTVKPGVAIVKPVILTKSNILLPDGVENPNEEPVFEIMLVGKVNPDYDLDVKVGDKVLITEINGVNHQRATKATTLDGADVGGYYQVDTRNIYAIVEYNRI